MRKIEELGKLLGSLSAGDLTSLPVILDFLEENNDWRRERFYGLVGKFVTLWEESCLDYKEATASVSNPARIESMGRNHRSRLDGTHHNLVRQVCDLLWPERIGDLNTYFTKATTDLEEAKVWLAQHPRQEIEYEDGMEMSEEAAYAPETD